MSELNELKKDISALTKTLILTSIILTTLFMLTSCAILDKLRGVANPHAEIVVETPTTIEDVRG